MLLLAVGALVIHNGKQLVRLLSMIASIDIVQVQGAAFPIAVRASYLTGVWAIVRLLVIRLPARGARAAAFSELLRSAKWLSVGCLLVLTAGLVRPIPHILPGAMHPHFTASATAVVVSELSSARASLPQLIDATPTMIVPRIFAHGKDQPPELPTVSVPSIHLQDESQISGCTTKFAASDRGYCCPMPVDTSSHATSVIRLNDMQIMCALQCARGELRKRRVHAAGPKLVTSGLTYSDLRACADPARDGIDASELQTLIADCDAPRDSSVFEKAWVRKMVRCPGQARLD